MREWLRPSVTVGAWLCFVCANDAKERVFVSNVHSGIPPVFGACSHAYILTGIQSAFQADCIAAMASAVRSHGILSPDPDSQNLCDTALPHRHTARSSLPTFALAKYSAIFNKTLESINCQISHKFRAESFALLHESRSSRLHVRGIKHISVPTLMFILLKNGWHLITQRLAHLKFAAGGPVSSITTLEQLYVIYVGINVCSVLT